MNHASTGRNNIKGNKKQIIQKLMLPKISSDVVEIKKAVVPMSLRSICLVISSSTVLNFEIKHFLM